MQKKVSNFLLAENYLLTSLRLNTEAGNQLNLAETYQELGLLYKQTGKMEESKKYFNLALEYFKEINSETDISTILKLLND
ncbi:MAG TPA: tetratricopeptide repeat protein [Ignavibacteriaceae bacterium]|nr:tetratricopeptide repeat protein [Ignavibacteriaceae bacterium]